MSTRAIVARATDHGLAFLSSVAGRTTWTEADAGARSFATLREATRVALRLPARYRAFALPDSGAGWTLAH
jgi:hypothetical protein